MKVSGARLAVLMIAAVPVVLGPRRQATPVARAVLPHVTAAEVPQYPSGAASAGSSGVVTLTVQTDGQRVSGAVAVNPDGSVDVLREAAIKNVRTWRFT